MTTALQILPPAEHVSWNLLLQGPQGLAVCPSELCTLPIGFSSLVTACPRSTSACDCSKYCLQDLWIQSENKYFMMRFYFLMTLAVENRCISSDWFAPSHCALCAALGVSTLSVTNCDWSTTSVYVRVSSSDTESTLLLLLSPTHTERERVGSSLYVLASF